MSENTEPEPATTRKRRSWDELSFGDRRTAEILLEHADFGREVAENSRTDRDFTLWLLDASLAFADITQEFPQDLAGSKRCTRPRAHEQSRARMIKFEAVGEVAEDPANGLAGVPVHGQRCSYRHRFRISFRRLTMLESTPILGCA